MTDRFSFSNSFLLLPFRCIGKLCALQVLCWRVRCRRWFPAIAPRRLDWPHRLSATPYSLLRGCVADLGTALRRMKCRFDALPEMWTYDSGPCFERDTSGGLRPNRDSDACMTDTESFQRQRPTATVFDLELFRCGWVAGVQYGRDSACNANTEQKSCNPPGSSMIADEGKGRA